jgi:carboxyl-terminal processing protease
MPSNHPLFSVARRFIACALVGLLLCAPTPPTVVWAAQSTATQAAPVDQAAAPFHTVEQAFDLLMDNFVHPLDSAALLNAGWQRLVKDASAASAPAPGPAPAFTGTRASDLDTVRGALSGYLTQQLPAGFSPTYSMVRGMVTLANEGHTYFLDPQQYQEYQQWTKGERRYIGVGVGLNTRGTEPVIVEVYEDTPAAKAGLRRGDVVLQIDGKTLSGLPASEVTGLMRGPADSEVQIVVRRPGEDQPRSFTVTRAEISLSFVSQHMIGDDIGYVQLRGFPEPSVVDAVVQALDSFQQQGARGIIIDLRGNSGGRIDVGTRLLSHFLPSGTSLFEEIDRAGHQTTDKARTSSQYILPLVVLVDGGTASMGEIFAAAVQEQGVATIVGATTAGSVAGSQVYALGDGSGLQVTVFEIRAAGGKLLNGVGVVPDEKIETDASALVTGADPALDRASEILRSAATALGVRPR